MKKEKATLSQAILSVGIHGAAGRMGTRLIQLIEEDPGLRLAAALVRQGHPEIGRDAGARAGVAATGVLLSASLPTAAAMDVMIDFSLPPAVPAVTECCRERKIPLVVGTTGLSQVTRSDLEKAAVDVPILIAPNMSRAVNLLMRLVGEAARSLGLSADIAIIERHHKTKKDAPSGTALRLAEFAGQQGRTSRLVGDNSGPDLQPRPGEITIHALRMADCPGEHSVIFGLPGETLELSHRALNRDGFARGALDCAVPGRQTGRSVYYGTRYRLLEDCTMASCERGYLCAVCGQDVESITDSVLYLRYVMGEVPWDHLNRAPETHIRCDKTLAQFIIDDSFEPVSCDGTFAKEHLDPEFVKTEEERVTLAYRRLRESREANLAIAEYPLPRVVARRESDMMES